LDLNGGLGRLYGSLGIAIRQPNVIVESSISHSLIIEGEDKKRARLAAERFLSQLGIKTKCKINIKFSIPSHIGLGSGTQLNLAIATSIAKLFDQEINIMDISRYMNRGSVSGIGTAAFDRGGFIIDAGRPKKLTKDFIPPTLFRYPFPENWFFVVAIPSVESGISGAKERDAFKNISAPPAELAGKLCRLVIMKLIPSLIEKNIENFGSALTRIQELTGESFSGIQGGTFAHQSIEDTVRYMLEEGAFGAGQSSWGPAVYGLIEGESNAKSLCNKINNSFNYKSDGKAFFTQADNSGAKISIEDRH
jgi:beta-RFAP synthase